MVGLDGESERLLSELAQFLDRRRWSLQSLACLGVVLRRDNCSDTDGITTLKKTLQEPMKILTSIRIVELMQSAEERRQHLPDCMELLGSILYNGDASNIRHGKSARFDLSVLSVGLEPSLNHARPSSSLSTS